MGAYDDQTTSEVNRYNYNEWPGDCSGSPPPWWQGSFISETSRATVDSYRGKPVYVQVGTKRRKAFHEFRRTKFARTTGKSAGWVCETGLPGGYVYNGWVEDFPFPDLRKRLNRADFRAVEGSTSPGIWYGDCPPMFPAQLDELGVHYRDFVIRDMYIKLNDPRFNVAVFLAELDETIVGIHGLFKGCLGSLFRTRIASKNIKHLILNPEELWLWWRYMLMPTMMDVEDLIAAFKRQVKIDRVQDGDRSDEPTTVDGTVTMHGHGRGYVDIDCNFESEYTYGCGGAMDIIMRYDPSPWGTSAWDVLMATWERIPFSFIFDWFINVGDWLASLRDIDYVLAQSYATYAIESKTKITSADPYHFPYGLDLEVESFSMDRVVDVEPPTLPLVDRKWQNTLRTIDLISLSIGMLKSVLKRRK